MAHHETSHSEPIHARLGPVAGRLTSIFLAVAAVGAAAALFQAMLSPSGYRRFMLAYVVAFAYVLSIALGGLFFVLIQHLTRAGWSVLIRRIAEGVAAAAPILILLFLPIAYTVVAGHGEVFPWAQHPSKAPISHTPADGYDSPDSHGDGHGHDAASKAPALEYDNPQAAPHAAHDHPHQKLDALTLGKRPWLEPSVFVIRWIVCLLIWAAVGQWLYRTSVRQDHDGDHRHSIRLESAAAPLLLLFAVTISIAAWDLLMSVNPHWYSTIFGVYYFSGSVIASLAFIILWVMGLQAAGVMPKAISTEHRHDLGKLLFAFVFFWGYIAFSQYMLIWYANLPEFTAWFSMRGATTVPAEFSGWTYVALVLLFGHFVIPFLGLLSRHVKRNPTLLCFWAIWMLVMHAVDLIWLVMPEMGTQVRLGAVEVGLIVALTGVYGAAVTTLLARQSLVPARDPRVGESLAFENI